MLRLIEELRNRNVFRVGAAYVVGCWLIAQVADLVGGVFNVPNWFMQVLILVMVLGLPVAVFLAWAFELTPEGLKKADDVPVDAPKDPRAGLYLNVFTMVTLLIAVGWLAYDKFTRSGAAMPQLEKSVAVLPFRDLSPEGNQAWFTDGLTEEILNALARTADLLVASRRSSFAYKDSTEVAPVIAGALGVAHILEGSVRRAGDRLRVTAQLVRAADDKNLWSKTYDGNSDDSISIQEQIAFDIANALQTAMDPDTLAQMVSAGTRSVEAWEAYLRALSLHHEIIGHSDLGNIHDVIAAYDHAVSLDPQFADAHLKLAELWESQLNPSSVAYQDSGLPVEERRGRYDAAIEGAARYARSEVTRVEAEMRAASFDLRFDDQVRLARQLTELEPENRNGWEWLQYLYLITGEYDKSREAGLEAWKLAPSPGENDGGIINYMNRVSVEDTVMMIDKALQEPNPPLRVLYHAHRGLLVAGDAARARAVLDEYLKRSGDEIGKLLMQVRQACAEGRVADADALFATTGDDASLRWLFLETLGRDAEADALLEELVETESLYGLSGFLVYPSFEARNFPALWKMLTAQGIERPPAIPIPYRCSR